MTNQENPSPLQVAQKEAYDLGVRTQKRKLKRIKKCLYKEQQWTEKLENALNDAGLKLPDRDKEIRQNFWSRTKFLFKRHWLSVIAVFLATLGLALVAIALWPHYHGGDLQLIPHWHNPFKVLVNGNASKA